MLRDSAFQAGLQRYSQGVNQMESLTDKGASVMTRVWAVGSAAVTIGAAAVVAGIAGIAAISKTGIDALVSWNEQVNTLSDNLGTTGEQSSAWAVAFAHVGLSVEEGGAGLNIFTKSLDAYRQAVSEGKGDTSDFGKTLQTLGVKAFDSAGKLRTFDDLMPDLLDAFKKLPPGVNKSALAMQLFGARGGTKFLDFLSQGSEGLDAAREKAKLYGLTLSTDLSNAVEDFTFALNDTNLGLKGFWVQIGVKVLPVVNKFVLFFNSKLLPPLVRFAEKIAPMIAGALDSIFNVFKLLVTGDFEGGIFGLSEDDDWIFALFTARDTILSLINVAKLLATGDFTGGIFGFTEDSLFIAALLTARDVVIGLFNTLSKGDWAGAWKVITDGAQNLLDVFTDQFGDPGTVFREWALHIWDWITDTALPTLITEGSKLIAGIVKFVQDHGPAAWGLLTEWGGKFWDWLAGEGGVISQVSKWVGLAATAIAAWFGAVWVTTIQPALVSWGTQFWGWLTGKDGAISQASAQLLQFAKDFETFAKSSDVQVALNEVGKGLGRGISDGIIALLSDKKEGTSWIQAVIANLIDAGKSLFEGLKAAGQALIGGFIEGIVGGITGDEAKGRMAKAIFLMFSNAVSDFITKGVVGIALDLVKSLIDAIQKAWEQLPSIPLLPKFNFTGAPTVPIPPTGSGGNPVPTSQMLPIALKVMIGDMEIKNAVVTWSTESNQSIFNDAVQMVGAA